MNINKALAGLVQSSCMIGKQAATVLKNMYTLKYDGSLMFATTHPIVVNKLLLSFHLCRYN